MRPLNALAPMRISNMYTSTLSLRQTNSCTYVKKVRANTTGIAMGPVSTAVVLYVVERLLTRVVAGQIHRKGIIRKIRRLAYMVVEFHMLSEIFMDIIEDVWTAN
jgi:hypothetical protein